MNELVNFDFAGKVVRIIIINGEPWWCALDVCNLLGYKRGRDAIAQHCKEKGAVKHGTLTNGGIQDLTYINESNLYRLITHSILPEAEKFESWVFDTVLPQIRKTGSFESNIPKTLPEALRAYATAVEEQEKLKQIVREQQPKVALAEQCLIATNLQSMLDVSKVLQIGRSKLFAFLRDEFILRKDNTPYQRFMEAGYFEVKLSSITMGEKVVNKTQTFVTPKGLDYIRERINTDKSRNITV
jgi:anti-repressor protein